MFEICSYPEHFERGKRTHFFIESELSLDSLNFLTHGSSQTVKYDINDIQRHPRFLSEDEIKVKLKCSSPVFNFVLVEVAQRIGWKIWSKRLHFYEMVTMAFDASERSGSV
ncbi:hypothetical protein M758_7G056500 [Ceratodon purpureus]|nr:hypothetical protein M758_7G056500 [Ceratodon purpureus]